MSVRPYTIPESSDVSGWLAAERRAGHGLLTYVSLFSSAGVGCHGFQQEGYHCIATVEWLERRLRVQRFNRKCLCDSGYIQGDMTWQETKDRVMEELAKWRTLFGVDDLDVLIATPPCQGMSVANHKKGDELGRNSLVVESISMVRQINPRFFIFENVKAFLTSACTDLDGREKPIGEAIETNLAGRYNILSRVVNFKDYGNPSSRTRTLVIGARKDLREVTPYDLFPHRQGERTLRQVIGHLPPLRVMGEVAADDIYHNFKPYAPRMEAWIADLHEGQSAFDNADPLKRPHTVRDGEPVLNARKNGDKYTRQCWDKVGPCIHTRNDILASQNTVHPADNRVFSIREVMLLMSVPDDFRWSDKPPAELNALPLAEKQAYLRREEMNIRQTLGEAVPTVIFRQVAAKMRKALRAPRLSDQEAEEVISRERLTEQPRLLDYLRKRPLDFAWLSKIAELSNTKRQDTAAYYTRQDICFSIVRSLPEAKGRTELRILEPSVGVGNFLPTLIAKYRDVPRVRIDVVDIDECSLQTLRVLVERMDIPENVRIDFIHDDFLLHHFSGRYDIVIGNPPFGKLTKDRKLLAAYKAQAANRDTSNLFAFFIEKAIQLGDVAALVTPKSLISAPEFGVTRGLMNGHRIERLIDFGEKGFKGVKIETLCFILDTRTKPGETIIESYITNEVTRQAQSYITDATFPYWLIYRDAHFDSIASGMEFNVFHAYRDRAITKSMTKGEGAVRVLKSRNIGDNRIVDIPGYDSYVDSVDGLDVGKYLNRSGCVLVPNLTYSPRACFLPPGCITDGSVAILTPVDDSTPITAEDLAFYATERFSHFYAIARNRGTRSLNIDNNSVFFFGRLKHPANA